LHWSATSNVVWSVDIPGTGWSSPALFHGRLYLTTAVKPDSGPGALRVLCLDARDGSTLWETEAFVEKTAAGIHPKNGHASPTPLVEGDHLFVHFGHEGTARLGLDGKVQWRQTGIKYTPVHGNGGSPARVDDLLVFSADGADDPVVVGLDAATGEIRWKTPRAIEVKRHFSFCTPLVIEVKGKKQIVLPGSGAVFAYDPKDGHELWRARYGEGYSVIPRPVYANGLIYVGTGYDRPWIHAVRPDGEGDVTDTHTVWKLAKGAPNTPSLLSVGDAIYAVSDGGIASCLDGKTGEVRWSERLGGDFSASPVFAAGRIYFQNETGTGFVVEPGSTYRLLAKNELGAKTLASYAVDEGTFYIRTESKLYKIGTGR
jgi:outer membrane protein assembly factor BamB